MLSPELSNHSSLRTPEPEPLPPQVELSTIYVDFIKYLLEHTASRLVESTGADLWRQYGADAEVILTHPNLWGPAQQDFLRNAAIEAGLISRERAVTNLHFIEEAEAAARYCVSRYSALFGRLQVCHSAAQAASHTHVGRVCLGWNSNYGL